jgi:DNA helicase-2/ATP-dependent DNA helicase PcrA
MPQAVRLVGSAGSGKTHSLMELLERLVERLGDVRSVGLASFSRGARAEAVSRACSIWGWDESALARDGWFRTLHSIAYRLADVRSGQLIVGDTKAGQEWLKDNLGVSLKSVLDDDVGATTFVGDSLEARALNLWDRARNSLRRLEDVCAEDASIYHDSPHYVDVLPIIERYETSKRCDDMLDFADVIMRFVGLGCSPASGYWDRPPAGEVPEIVAWLIDEAQDLSPLTAKVVERISSAPSCKWLYLVGDPFQSIYGFAGATPRPFMDWPVERQRVMPRSYRCPVVISELGEQVLSGCSDYWRRGVEPAPHAGAIDNARLEELPSIVNPADDWLLIARTNYHAAKIRGLLDRHEIPHRSTHSEGVTQTARGKRALWMLEQGKSVDPVDFGYALQLIPSAGLLEWGAKSKYDASAHERIHITDLGRVGCKEALQTAVFTGEWAALIDGGQRFASWAERYGIDAAACPRIRVGTIHSVKGSEADNVLLLNASVQRFDTGAKASTSRLDEELRLGYVGVTRARRRLVVASDAQAAFTMPGL